MEDKTKVSIITVSYNSMETIERTILSVLNQSYRNIEYIIIDGGSKDNTLHIIRKYQSNIKHLISEPDKGISDAFNKGILLAEGEIIGILNSDDWYESDTIDTAVRELNKSHSDFLVGALRYWDKNGNNFIVHPDKISDKKVYYMMPNLNHPASFFRSDVYKAVGIFNLKYKYAMDYDFFLRVFQAKKTPTFTNKILTNMSLAGVSDNYTIRAYTEEYRIAPLKFRACLHFIFAVSKYYIRQFLVKIKLVRLLFWIRKLKYKN